MRLHPLTLYSITPFATFICFHCCQILTKPCEVSAIISQILQRRKLESVRWLAKAHKPGEEEKLLLLSAASDAACLCLHLLCYCASLLPLTYLLYLFIYLFIYWVFIAAHGLFLVAVSQGYSWLWCAGFSSWWLLLLWSMGSRHASFSSCGTRAQ